MLPGGEWHVAAPSVLTMVLFYGCLVIVVASEWAVAVIPVGCRCRSALGIALVGLVPTDVS